MPDLLVFYGGRTIGIELKRVGGKLTKIQEEMRKKLSQAGIIVHVCCAADEVVLALRAEGFPLRKLRSEGTLTTEEAVA